jgi:lipid II:glycine glycyltransferase (peptidoglycan interpeptide bridge formation enzyme)
VRSDHYTGTRHNSLLGVSDLTAEAIEELSLLPRKCDLTLEMPEERYLAEKRSFAGLFFRPIWRRLFFFLDLPDTYEKWFTSPGVDRAAVRKAQRCGVAVAIGGQEMLASFYETYLASFRRWRQHGLAKAATRLDSFARVFDVPGSRTKVALASYQGQSVSAAVFCAYESTAAVFFAGTNYDYQNLRPGNLVYAEIFRYLIDRKIRLCNIGSDMGNPGLAHFKKMFGPRIQKTAILRRHRFPRLRSLLS